MKNFYTIAMLVLSLQSGWAQTPFYPTASASGRHFGSKVDVDGNEIIVSSKSFTLFPQTQGSVYLFELNGDVISQTMNFMPGNVLPTDGFGTGISIENDFVAIGSPDHNNLGSTYIYKKNAGNWEFLQQLASPQPNPGAKFGPPVFSGNYLFISAIADEPNGEPSDSDNGILYIYTFSGTEWTFLQSEGIGSALNFGDQIQVQGDTMIVSSTGLSSSKIFHRYILVNGLWAYANSSPEFGSLEMNVGDFQLEDNKLFLLTETEQNEQVLILDCMTWSLLSTVDIPQDDQIYSTIAVSDDKMFVGSSGYILQMTRKFPVQYFRKIGGNWIYQYALYGTAPSSADDFFGQALAIDGENLIIGAPQEGEALPTGKAYYVNTGSLSTPNFNVNAAKLVPNPVTDSFSILTDVIATPDKIEIYSIHGQLLLTVDSDAADINVSTLFSGIYFAKLHHYNGASQTFKFIKK